MSSLHQTANAVSTHLGTAAIGVIQDHPETIAVFDLKQQQTVGTNPESTIAPALREFGPCKRTISLRHIDD
jgi:hypothetical protein